MSVKGKERKGKERKERKKERKEKKGKERKERKERKKKKKIIVGKMDKRKHDKRIPMCPIGTSNDGERGNAQMFDIHPYFQALKKY